MAAAGNPVLKPRYPFKPMGLPLVLRSIKTRRSSIFQSIGFLIVLVSSNAALALTTLTVTISSDNNPGGIGEPGDLRYSLNAMNQDLNTVPDDYAIVFASPMTIQLNGNLPVVNNSSNPVNITIGNPGAVATVTIDGNSGAYSGFFIPIGNVTIRNMTLQNMTARGGNGGDGISGGGGGLGAGGAIYAPQFFLNGSNPSVTLSNVSISNCGAVGGNGGSYIGLSLTGNEGGGGGGGFAGNGGSITTSGITGGAGGGGFGGDGGNVTLSTSNLLGGGGGGGGGLGSRATVGTLTNLGNGGSDQDFGQDGSGYGVPIIAGSGGGGLSGGSNAGGGGGGGAITFSGGGGGGSAGLNGLLPQGAIAPLFKAGRVPVAKSAVPSGGTGGDGGGGGGGAVVTTSFTNEIDGKAANGGYGGGGGGGAGTGAYDFDYSVQGGSGGLGGGGGGGGVNQSGLTPANGGHSLGGGGGAGGGPSNGFNALGGSDLGNLGGGTGGIGANAVGPGFGGGGGGGGSGLGGAIFVDSNLNFTLQALPAIPTTFNTLNNTTQAGVHGTGVPGGSDGNDGSALGNSIFLRTGSSLTFIAPDAGDLLTLGDQVAFTDDTVFGAGGTTVFVKGDGTVVYNGTTDYQGTVTINNATFKVNGVIDQAPVVVDRNSSFSAQKGTLGGTGTLTGDVIVNAGTVAPDRGATLILGSLALLSASSSTVHIDIDSSGTSLVAVSGPASLAGTLEINLDPAANKPGSYTILTSAAVTGTFATITFTGATPANYLVSYLPAGAPTRVQLDMLASTDMAATISFPSTATTGSTVNGTFSCANNGPSAADAATCSISGLPSGATVNCLPAVPTSSPLPSGSSIECTASFTAPASGAVSATVTAGSTTADLNGVNNVAQATTSMSASADMTATSAFPPTAQAGSTVSGTFTCTNNGPSAATAATCSVAGLPAGATVSCTPPVPTATPLAPGSSVVCSASYTAPGNGSVTVNITAGSSTSDPNTANNMSPATTTAAAAVPAAPIPVNAWWALVALMLAMLGGATVANRRRH